MKYTAENTVDIGKPKEVLLDGKPVRNVFEADTEDGYVLIAEEGPDGKIKLTPDNEIVTQRLAGVVVVSDLVE